MTKGPFCPWCMEDLDFKHLEKIPHICPEGHVHIPKSKHKNLYCPECKKDVSLMQCPFCGTNLPPAYETFDEYRAVTLVGPKQVGKTVFLTVLTHEMTQGGIHSFVREFSTSVNINTQFMNTLNKNYVNLYNDKENERKVLEYTKTGDQRPLVLELKNTAHGTSLALVIYDTPGELYGVIDKNDEVNRPPISNYLRKSDGILFLIDPLQLPSVRDVISIPESSLPMDNGDLIYNNMFKTILTQISACIRVDKSNVTKDNKINKKMAVVLMKFDVLMKAPQNNAEAAIIFGPDSIPVNVSRDPSDSPADWLSKINYISQDLEDRFINIHVSDLGYSLRAEYMDFKFFPTSALGENPNGLKLSHVPMPFKIYDPFVWLLSATDSHVLD